jgi:hypothetical protein
MSNDTISQKICTVCRASYPATLEYFPPRKKRKSGLDARCRECKKQRRRELNGWVHTRKVRPSEPDGMRWCSRCEQFFGDYIVGTTM